MDSIGKKSLLAATLVTAALIGLWFVLSGTDDTPPGAVDRPDGFEQSPIVKLLEDLKTAPYVTNRHSHAIMDAARSGDKRYIPLLKELVSIHSSKSVCADLMNALYLLGEPKEYFLEYARNHKQAKWPAYFAIWVLARDPDEKTLAKINRIADETVDSQLDGVCQEAKMVFYQDQRMRSTIPVSEKVSMLMLDISYGWSPLTGMPNMFGSGGEQAPLPTWARGQLLKLSSEEPEKTAKAIIEETATNPDYSAAYRAYLTTLLSPECARYVGQLVSDASQAKP